MLFVLQQEVTMYDAYLQRIEECDRALEQHLKGLADKAADPTDAVASPGPRDARPRITRRRNVRRCRSGTSLRDEIVPVERDFSRGRQAEKDVRRAGFGKRGGIVDPAAPLGVLATVPCASTFRCLPTSTRHPHGRSSL